MAARCSRAAGAGFAQNTTATRARQGSELIKAVNTLGCTTCTFCDAQGLPVKSTDARRGTKRLDWTPRGELATYADCSGQRTLFDYYPMGLVRSTYAIGHQQNPSRAMC